STKSEALIGGPLLILQPVPVLDAPGDELITGVTVANNVEGSGPKAEIELRAQTNEQLSISGGSSQTLRVAEGREQTAIFKFRANDKLGFGEITFVARWNGQETKRRATLSVRPAGPYMTEVHSGSFKD